MVVSVRVVGIGIGIVLGDVRFDKRQRRAGTASPM